MQGNALINGYDIDGDGDFVIEGVYIYNVIVCGDAYYPDTSETYDGVEEILFEGLDNQQGKIFALCVEGWI